MELYQLRYFERVARHGSVSGASRELHVSQPAISKAIAKLEDELGVALFDRSGNKLRLNPRGELFLEGVQRVGRELDDSITATRHFENQSKELLRIAVYGPQKEALGCTTDFMQVHPNVRLVFNVHHDDSAMFGGWESSIVFYQAGVGFNRIAGIAYASRSIVLVIPESHPLYGVEDIGLGDFRNESFVMLNNKQEMYERSLQLCSNHGFYPLVRAISSNKQALLEFVRTGLGVGLLDGPPDRKLAGFRFLKIPQESGLNDLCLACRNVNDLSTVEREYLDFALARFGIANDSHIKTIFEANG